MSTQVTVQWTTSDGTSIAQRVLAASPVVVVSVSVEVVVSPAEFLRQRLGVTLDEMRQRHERGQYRRWCEERDSLPFACDCC